MFTTLQCIVLIVLRQGSLGFVELMDRVTVEVTEVGLKRTLTILERGEFVKSEKGIYSLTTTGETCMSSQGAEYKASKCLKKKSE